MPPVLQSRQRRLGPEQPSRRKPPTAQQSLLPETVRNSAHTRMHLSQSIETMRAFMMALSATALAVAAALGALLTLRPGRAGGLKLMYTIAAWPCNMLVQVSAAGQAAGARPGSRSAR